MIRLINDLINDTNLHQIVNIPTRNDRILDLIMVNNPTYINKVTTLPPIGSSDHDIVYAEADIWLKRIRETPRKIYKYNKANWENIKTDIENIHKEIINSYDALDINKLWEIFKTKLIITVEKNIPSKMLRSSHRLPWITDKLRRLINKKNKLFKKAQGHQLYTEKYKKTAYWE